MRIKSVEDKVESLAASAKEHGAALSDGKVQFAEIRKDLASVTEAVKGVSANINRGVWIIVGSVAAAVLGLVIKTAGAHP